MGSKWIMGMNHKRRYCLGLLLLLIITSGFVVYACSGSIQEEKNKCYLCGDGGLMGYYKRFDSIGLLNVNTGQLMDIPIFDYEDDGKTLKEERGSSTMYNSSGKGRSTVVISTGGTRRIGNVTILPGDNSNLDETMVDNVLCENCKQLLLKKYEDRIGEYIPDYVFVDFVERTLHPIDKRYGAYFIRDYYLHFDYEEDRVEVLIFFAPEGR